MINYTLDDAAKILTKESGRDVTKSHLLQLAIQGKIALSMLYGGLALAYEKDNDEEIKDVYGWFDIPPRFLEKLINNEPCIVNMLMGEDSCYFLQEGVSKSLTATYENLFIVGQRLDLLIKLNAFEVQTQVSIPFEPKQLRQERLILEAIETLGYDCRGLPPNIPGMPGAKAGIRSFVSDKHRADFQGTVFDKAWDRLLMRNEINYGE